MKKQMQLVRCTVNGREVEEYVDVRESLLDMLRNRLGLTSVKKGCEVGECGACTVIIDGETIDSCIYLAVWAECKNIRKKAPKNVRKCQKRKNFRKFTKNFSKGYGQTGFYVVNYGKTYYGERAERARYAPFPHVKLFEKFSELQKYYTLCGVRFDAAGKAEVKRKWKR